MSSPFEIFRSPIQIRRFTQGYYLNGVWQEGTQIVLGSVLVTGNVVSITLNGVVLSPITFSISAANTMALIQSAIAAQPGIDQVDISSNNLVISIVPLLPNLSNVSNFSISGGASQPTVTINNSPTIINATASIQPTKGKEVLLVPEGRRDQETYKMYTSTEINGVTTQNPDQITILTPNFSGTVFEVI